MAGNVWEWTSSYYAEDKLVLVLRGGSWLNEADNARCANRSRNVPHVRSDNVGFRVAESLS
jgi:formylglycine-generating enzyme required for sulfatase activity